MTMGKWRDRLAAAKDTVDDAVFKATEPIKRCPSTSASGKRCDLDRGHGGSHENGVAGEVW
jgi:hypothetical protein